MKIQGPGESSLLLLKVIKLLEKCRIPYAIVGAFAGSAKDIQDAVGVLQISKERIKFPLLKQLTLHYGKKELKKLEEVLKSS